VIIKDYYAGAAQSWTVDFNGANAVTIDHVITQLDESTTAIGTLWAETRRRSSPPRSG